MRYRINERTPVVHIGHTEDYNRMLSRELTKKWLRERADIERNGEQWALDMIAFDRDYRVETEAAERIG